MSISHCHSEGSKRADMVASQDRKVCGACVWNDRSVKVREIDLCSFNLDHLILLMYCSD